MPAYNFKSEFARAVELGTKRQTIRRRRKRPTKVGYNGLRARTSGPGWLAVVP
jgi:hypothetical protein